MKYSAPPGGRRPSSGTSAPTCSWRLAVSSSDMSVNPAASPRQCPREAPPVAATRIVTAASAAAHARSSADENHVGRLCSKLSEKNATRGSSAGRRRRWFASSAPRPSAPTVATAAASARRALARGSAMGRRAP
ncbi:MAG: hypothetical protein U0325_35895 [Polyangiales bacterium]